MKHIISVILMATLYCSAYCQDLNTESQQIIEAFIEHIKTDDVEVLKTKIAYPLKREYPLPHINNTAEFQKYYHILFDTSLKDRIVSSDIQKDWSVVGSEGIMFGNGLLWLNHKGQVIALNYQSEEEAGIKDEIINKNRLNIHESLRDFANPAYTLTTKKFIVRIDKMADGQYRYASWTANSDMTQKPDLVLFNGKMSYDGSGGNHSYQFKNGIYTYEVYVFVIGTEDSHDAELNVYKNSDRIVNQPSISKKTQLPFTSDQLLISTKQAGIFKIGDQIPGTDSLDKQLSVRKENQIRYTEDGEVEEPFYIYSYNGIDLLKLKPAYDYNIAEYTNTIGQIYVLSDEFTTSKGVGVGTTIRTFISKYPDYSLWYTYISGMYVIDSNELKAQFLLDENDLIGSPEIKGDMTILKPSDFKEGAQVKTIRLF
ncbi:hypothetical protein [Carboxylicivirga sp. RSCT41]|uniref:hypothetical protein n=1 Tax=Carboxylicivirga agarovorans TaxID=3417570 RepID=UPI003D341D0B